MNKRETASVSASQLAQMGTCERMVQLEHQLGRRTTRLQDRAIARGLAEHHRFKVASTRLMATSGDRPGGRCFIATLTLGEGHQLTTLREYRDTVLKRSSFGRKLVYRYYRMGPRLCSFLARHTRLQRLTRLVVQVLSVLAAWHLACRRLK